MATDIHRYFGSMGDWSPSARSTICEVNLSYFLCLYCSDIVFAAEPFVDKVLGCT